MEDINLSVENKNKLHISFDKSLNVLKNNKLNKEKKVLFEKKYTINRKLTGILLKK